MQKPRKPVLYWKRGKYWYYRLAGEGKWRTTAKTSRTRAEEYVDEKRAQPEADPGRTLREYSEPFFHMGTDPRVLRKLEEGKQVGLQHLQNSRRWLKLHVLTDAIADKPMGEITRSDLLEFRRRLLEKHPDKRTTVNRVMETLKTIFREAVFQGDLSADPTMGIGKVNTEGKERGVLTAAELRKLWPVTGHGPWQDQRDHTAFLLAATTGMRRGEIMALRWEDVDLEEKAVVIRRAWKKAEDEMGPPKSGKPRVVPLPSKTVRALEKLRDSSIRLAPEDLVICYDDGEHVGESWWRKRFIAALKKAKIADGGRNISPHGLRHTISTLLDKEGQNPELIRDTFGWTSEQIRRRYLHRGADHYREQAEIIDRLLAEEEADKADAG